MESEAGVIQLIRAFLAIVLLFGAAFCCPAARAQTKPSDPISIPQGASVFTFDDPKGDPFRPVKVLTYLPKGLDVKTARILFVMHGQSKDAQGMLNVWIPYADKYGCILLAPRFDPVLWYGGEYSYSSIYDWNKKLRDPSKWSFNVIEHLFDAVKETLGNTSKDYFIYGHSEGGQFVHRLVLLLPQARYAKAIAANAGWYTMPTFDVQYPYGLGGSPETKELLATVLSRNVIVLLGDADTDPNHPQLLKTDQAEAEGATRFERGNNFYATASRRATEMSCAFNWKLQTVPGAAHENAKMAAQAAVLFFEH